MAFLALDTAREGGLAQLVREGLVGLAGMLARHAQGLVGEREAAQRTHDAVGSTSTRSGTLPASSRTDVHADASLGFARGSTGHRICISSAVE